MVERIHAAGVVLYRADSVLLVRHTSFAKLPEGSYGFPAGRVEKGEMPYETAIRELEEESGLITYLRYLIALPVRKNRVIMKKGAEDFIFHPFLCMGYSGNLRSSRQNVPEFVSLDCLDNLLLVAEDVKELAIHGHALYLQNVSPNAEQTL